MVFRSRLVTIGDWARILLEDAPVMQGKQKKEHALSEVVVVVVVVIY